MLILVKLFAKYVIIYALGSRYIKSLASESKPFQSRSKGEIPGRARRKERAHLPPYSYGLDLERGDRERMAEKRKQQCLHPVFKLTAQLEIVFERHVLHEHGLYFGRN